MYNKSPILRIVCKVSWFLTASAAILAGLRGLGYDVLNVPFVQQNFMALVKPMQVVFGVAGVISLALFVMACMKKK